MDQVLGTHTLHVPDRHAARSRSPAGVLAADLDKRTAAFISDRATQLEHHAAAQARIEGDIRRLREYQDLLHRHQQQVRGREELEAQRDELTAQINSRELSPVDAEDNVRALERRMLEYLQELHVPTSARNCRYTSIAPHTCRKSRDAASMSYPAKDSRR
jgi:chromosome segregation ATPase